MMEEIIQYLLTAAVFMNGWLFRGQTEEWDSNTLLIHKVVDFVCTGLFGFILYPCYLIFLGIVALLGWLAGATQFKFWWRWWFTDHYENLPEERIVQLNNNAKLYFGICKRDKNSSIATRHHLHCLKKIRRKYPKEYFKWIDNPENFNYK